MEDALIVDLYWARDEQALAETAAKFGTYCRKIADNILHSAHDAEECENDTWLAAWNSIHNLYPFYQSNILINKKGTSVILTIYYYKFASFSIRTSITFCLLL